MSELHKLRANVDTFLESFRRKDLDKLFSIYDPECVYCNASAPKMQGLDQIKPWYERAFSMAEGEIDLVYKEENAILGEGMGLIVGRFYFRKPEGSQEPGEAGRVVTVHRKAPDGQWKMVFDMDNNPPDCKPEDFGFKRGSPPEQSSGEKRKAKFPHEVSNMVVEFMNQGDLEGIVGMYHPDCIVAFPPGTPPKRGLTGVREAFAELAKLKPNLISKVTGEIINGDTALLQAEWRIEGDDGSVIDSGTSAEVTKRLADGSWVYYIDCPSGAPAIAKH